MISNYLVGEGKNFVGVKMSSIAFDVFSTQEFVYTIMRIISLSQSVRLSVLFMLCR